MMSGVTTIRNESLAKDRVQPHARRHRCAGLADRAEAGRCQQKIGVGQGVGSRLDTCKVHPPARCVTGVHGQLVQDSAYKPVEGLESVAIQASSKRKRVRPRKDLEEKRILRHVDLETFSRQTPVREAADETMRQRNPGEILSWLP